MKKISLFLFMLLPFMVLAQAPSLMSYQAVVRNSSNQLVSNQTVGVRVSVLQGSSNGTAAYIETHAPTTDANGAMALQVGSGSVESGIFANINWSTGNYWLKSEIDPDGGSNYTISGAQQLMSVPYALYAENAGTVSTGASDTSSASNSGGGIAGCNKCITHVSELSPGDLNWIEAVDYCLALDEGGYTDWRLPTMEEVLHYRTAMDLSIIFEYETNEFSRYLWTSTSVVSSDNSGDYWYIDEVSGKNGVQDVIVNLRVRCAR